MEDTDTAALGIETPFVGGRLCLDFINTACKKRCVDLDFLTGVEELRQWLRAAEIVHKAQLLSASDDDWSEGLGAVKLKRTIDFRVSLRALVDSVILKQPAPQSAVYALNSVLHAHPIYSYIAESADGFQEMTSTVHPVDDWLAVIARDALDLLCHSDLSLLRECESPTCVRVFVDTTKNHRRRWCGEKCGSAPKAAAYYRRKVAKTRSGAVGGLR